MSCESPALDQGALAEALSAALLSERERYGQAPELRLDSEGRLRGFVVTRSQGERIAASLGVSGDALAALDDPAHAETSEAWLCARETLDGWAAPEGAKLQNQVLAGEVFRLLSFPACAGRRLAQTADRALAWYAAEDLRSCELSGAGFGECLGLGRASAGPELLDCEAARMRSLSEVARALIGAPYRLGGRDPKTGIDCSALVGRVVHELTGVSLPRHSGDQRSLGVKVVQSKVRAGDLLFATSKARRISHVAIFVEADRLVHACLREQRVIEEPLEEFLEAYDWRIARRLWKDQS